MADFELIEERRISGKGVLRLPAEAARRRMVVLYTSLLRPPKNPYVNLNYSPYRSRYGFLTFLRNGYVVSDGAIEYEKQSYDTLTDITGQNLIAIKCAYEGLLQSFVNQNIALGLVVTSVVDLIQDYDYLDLAWDEIRVVCYADTALLLRLYTLPFDKCADAKDSRKKPPKPPDPPAPVPPGTPIDDLDPPYDNPEDEDTFTDPYPGDSFPPETIACQKYSVTFSGTLNNGFGRVPFSGSATVFGVVGDFSFDTANATNWRLMLECQGLVVNQFSVCGDVNDYPIYNGGFDYQDVVVSDPVLVP